MDNILISIIVPAYNIEEYIGRCLDSILLQSHKTLEIIVVDDGSTDRTGQIIDQYVAADQRIISIHKKNGGVSSARLAGIAKATGEYIGFVDGDDYIEPKMFKHLLKNAIKYNADISHCGYQMVFPDGHVDTYYGTRKLLIQNGEEAVRDLLKGSFVEPALWNKLFNKSIIKGFDESSIWDATIKINEDLLMNYILFSRVKTAVYEDIEFYHYVLRKGSAATSQMQKYKLIDPLKVISNILDDVKENKVLYPIAFERYLRALINIAVQDEWKEEAVQCTRTLKHNVKRLFQTNGILVKFKFMVVGVAYLKPVYMLVRKVYAKTTGVDRKYKLE